MASAEEFVVQAFRTLDPDGTGAVPRAAFEFVLQKVSLRSLASLESFGFALPGVDSDKVRYEEFFEWIYGRAPAPAEQEYSGDEVQGLRRQLQESEAKNVALQGEFSSLCAANAAMKVELAALKGSGGGTPRHSIGLLEAAERPSAAERLEATLDEVPPLDVHRLINYSVPQELYNQLREPTTGGPPPVKLLKGEWLLNRAEQLRQARSVEERRKLALPRRQVLEIEAPEAFFTADEFIAIACAFSFSEGGCDPVQILNLASVSHCWETPTHPDPTGQTLLALADAINRARTERIHCSEASSLRHITFPQSDFGVFFDWASLCQKDDNGERTEAEAAAFHAALDVMQLWYGHLGTTCFLLTGQQDGATGPSYHDRGWPTFERLVSMIGKMINHRAWPLIVDVGSNTGRCDRLCPLTPDAFAELLETKTFTNGTDRAVVIKLYRQTLIHVCGTAPILSMMFRPHWGDAEMKMLVELLPLCKEMKILDLQPDTFFQLTDAGLGLLAAAMKAGKMPPKLKAVYFHTTSEYQITHEAFTAYEQARNGAGIQLWCQ